MRYPYLSPVVAALALALTVPGRVSAQATTDSTKASASVSASAQTVTCKDGSTSAKGQGACSHHGGVVRMVSCKDGTTAKRGRGACSHHGGMVAKTKTSASAKTSSNQTKSGVTNTKTGESTMGKGVTKTSPDAGAPVTAKGDTLKGGDSAASTPR